MKSLYPLLFEPNFREVVWGGGRLLEWKGLPPADVPIGESWEVCSLPERESVISNGPYAGRKLNDFTDEMGEKVLGRAVVRQYGRQLPLLVKLIDAHQDLSIQVHPNDEMAMRYHGKKGKTEMWYVIDAEPGSSVLVGFKKKITPLEYGLRVMDGTICDVLARHEVKPGDVFYIPSGRVHAICGGILLAEVQQSSDITYRIFDYDRPGIDGRPRELHTEMAAKAIDYEVLDDYLKDIDQILVMSVEPGFGGQKFMDSSLPKIAYYKQKREELGLDYVISVDGGVGSANAHLVRDAGVDLIVAGSAVFKAADRTAEIAAIKG